MVLEPDGQPSPPGQVARDKIMAAGMRAGLRLTDIEVANFVDGMACAERYYEQVEAAYTTHVASSAVRPRRRWWDSDPDEDPHGRWVRRCEVVGDPAGALADLTAAVEDTVAIGGVPMNLGTRRQLYRPRKDALVVARLLAAGVRLAGTTSMLPWPLPDPAHGFLAAVDPDPYVFLAMPGAVSGAAGCVAAGEVDVVVGLDQLGGTRLTAATGGVLGLAAPRGAIPTTGCVPLSPILDTVGVMARTPQTLTRTFAALWGPDGADLRSDATAGTPGPEELDWSTETLDGLGGLRVGLIDGVDGGGQEYTDGLGRLEAAGAQLTHTSLDAHHEAAAAGMVLITDVAVPQLIAFGGTGAASVLAGDPDLATALVSPTIDAPTGSRAGSTTMRMYLTAGTASRNRHHGAPAAMAGEIAGWVADSYRHALTEVDLLITPTVPAPPGDPTTHTAGASMAGLPALSIPIGPTGMQVIAADPRLCMAAAQVLWDAYDHEWPWQNQPTGWAW
jgi:aspartyl-tRNA(Asn)/glutamyl-tRNA(Gln) amidotransferase subunit A